MIETGLWDWDAALYGNQLGGDSRISSEQLQLSAIFLAQPFCPVLSNLVIEV